MSVSKLSQEQVDLLADLRDDAKKHHMVIQYKPESKHVFLVYRIIDSRAIFQGKRYTLESLKGFVHRLVRTVDYENSKIEC